MSDTLLIVLVCIVVVPIAVYSIARLITHAVLKTRRDFDSNGGGQ